MVVVKGGKVFCVPIHEIVGDKVTSELVVEMGLTEEFIEAVGLEAVSEAGQTAVTQLMAAAAWAAVTVFVLAT